MDEEYGGSYLAGTFMAPTENNGGSPGSVFRKNAIPEGVHISKLWGNLFC